ncbi:phosphate ABC transporter permease PstA [candidate division TA06 bacterium]|nr:phosphate ABC transporter permease PstA [candidate division TA06 bacterium]
MKLDPKHTQKAAVAVLGSATLLTLTALVFIIVFVLQKGLPVLSWAFLTGSPQDMGRAGGIFPAIVGSVSLTVLAVLLAAPLGVGTAVYLTEYTRESRLTVLIRFGADCLAGIPSIIFGLFGFILFVTIMKMGWSLLAGSLTLALMILPTIIRTTEEAIKAVPLSYREVSYSLGATRWQTVHKVILPNALPGILTGVMLGVGRALGETAAVIFTAGSSLRMPASVFDSVRTMAVHFYLLAREGISPENAYGTAAALIIAVLSVNLLAYWMMNRMVAKRA